MTPLSNLFGMRVFEHPLAYKIVYKVERHPIKKRRRNWHVVQRKEPCAFIVNGDTMYVAPEIMATLRSLPADSRPSTDMVNAGNLNELIDRAAERVVGQSRQPIRTVSDYQRITGFWPYGNGITGGQNYT